MQRLFIVHLHNQIRFDQNGYNNETLAREAVFSWSAISSSQRAEEIWMIQNKELQLQDSRFFAFGSFSQNSEMIFNLKSHGKRPYEFKDRVHHTLSFEMSLNLQTAEREVYHVLDWIGDIGGLFDGLRIFLQAILGIVTYKMYDSYMVAQLFSVRSNKHELTGRNKV